MKIYITYKIRNCKMDKIIGLIKLTLSLKVP